MQICKAHQSKVDASSDSREEEQVTWIGYVHKMGIEVPKFKNARKPYPQNSQLAAQETNVHWVAVAQSPVASKLSESPEDSAHHICLNEIKCLHCMAHLLLAENWEQENERCEQLLFYKQSFA